MKKKSGNKIKKCKYSMVIMGAFLLSTGIMACSSATVSETKAEASESPQTQEDLAETSETLESSAALETGGELKGFNLQLGGVFANMMDIDVVQAGTMWLGFAYTFWIPRIMTYPNVGFQINLSVPFGAIM